MFIFKALGKLCLLPFKLIWFILKVLAYVCTLFQYDPWKRAPLQQLKDLEFYSVNFNTRVRLRDKRSQKLAIKDAKLVYKFIKKHSKWPRWLDKEFGEHRINLGFDGPRTKSHFVGECKRRMGMYGVALQHCYGLVCTEKDLAKLHKKFKVSEVDSRRVDQTADVLGSYGAALYNACAEEGVLLTRTNCDCHINGISTDFTTTCCPEVLKYSKKGQKGVLKAMVSVLKKKECVRIRVDVKGGEAPAGHDRGDDDEPMCGGCGEERDECECEEFQEPSS